MQTSIAAALDRFTAETPAVAWLRRAGPIARKLNEEAQSDGFSHLHDTKEGVSAA